MDCRYQRSSSERPVAEVIKAKIQIPQPQTGTLERTRLLEPLMTADDSSVVVLRAPAGSGKTTLLAQWAAADRARDFAWLSLDETDNDPVTLWRYVVAALGTVAPEATDKARVAVNRPAPDVTHTVVPELLNTIAELRRPLVLVLDDYQMITDQSCHDSINPFLRQMAGPLTVVIASRVEPLNSARMAVQGRARILSGPDLAFNGAEILQLLARLGVRPTRRAATQLISETDGWAAGVRLSIGRSRSPDEAQRLPEQVDLIREFLIQEIVETLDPADRELLRRCSILNTLEPGLDECVTGMAQVGNRLAELSKGNVLIRSVDDRNKTYRIHQLLRDVLQTELHEHDPDERDRLHELATTWFIEHDRPIEAVEHALRVSEPDLAAHTIAGCWFETIMTGRLATVTRWLTRFDDSELRRFPFVLIAAAWAAGFRGDWGEAWRYSQATTALTTKGQTPDGTRSFESARALMRAGLGLEGVTEVRAQAEIANRLEDVESPWRPLATALLGAANLALGRDEEARHALSEAANSLFGPHGVATYAMGQLAILEAGEHQWTEVERVSGRAIEESERLGIENLVSSGAAYVMHAAAAAHRGDVAIARRRLRALNPLLPSLSTAMPFDAFQIHLLTAETYAAIGDLRAAAVHAEAARQHHELLADAGILEARLAAMISKTPPDASTAGRPRTAPTLTARERDILALLPTTLTLREVGDELYVSRDTVKSYVTRIYRKLGVSSRSAAVTRATELGMLERA